MKTKSIIKSISFAFVFFFASLAFAQHDHSSHISSDTTGKAKHQCEMKKCKADKKDMSCCKGKSKKNCKMECCKKGVCKSDSTAKCHRTSKELQCKNVESNVAICGESARMKSKNKKSKSCH